MGTVPAKKNSWNFDRKRLFVGTVPAIFSLIMELGLSLQLFVIDHGNMTGRGYLWVLCYVSSVPPPGLGLNPALCYKGRA